MCLPTGTDPFTDLAIRAGVGLAGRAIDALFDRPREQPAPPAPRQEPAPAYPPPPAYPAPRPYDYRPFYPMPIAAQPHYQAQPAVQPQYRANEQREVADMHLQILRGRVADLNRQRELLARENALLREEREHPAERAHIAASRRQLLALQDRVAQLTHLTNVLARRAEAARAAVAAHHVHPHADARAARPEPVARPAPSPSPETDEAQPSGEEERAQSPEVGNRRRHENVEVEEEREASSSPEPVRPRVRQRHE